MGNKGSKKAPTKQQATSSASDSDDDSDDEEVLAQLKAMKRGMETSPFRTMGSEVSEEDLTNAEQMESPEQIKVGELAIVEIVENKWVYARLSVHDDDGGMAFHVDSKQTLHTFPLHEMRPKIRRLMVDEGN